MTKQTVTERVMYEDQYAATILADLSTERHNQNRLVGQAKEHRDRGNRRIFRNIRSYDEYAGIYEKKDLIEFIKRYKSAKGIKRIPLAILFGSRSMGMHGVDSDYDIIVVRAGSNYDYLNIRYENTLYKKRRNGKKINYEVDFIHKSTTDEYKEEGISIVAHDIRKFITLMLKSNPTIVEIINSSANCYMDIEEDNNFLNRYDLNFYKQSLLNNDTMQSAYASIIRNFLKLTKSSRHHQGKNMHLAKRILHICRYAMLYDHYDDSINHRSGYFTTSNDICSLRGLAGMYDKKLQNEIELLLEYKRNKVADENIKQKDYKEIMKLVKLVLKDDEEKSSSSSYGLGRRYNPSGSSMLVERTVRNLNKYMIDYIAGIK